MRRVLIYDHLDRPVMELSPLDVVGLNRHEELNGERSLSISCLPVLQKGQRILTQDDRGKWREHVVYGTDEGHESGDSPIGDYYCVWSLMHDLMGTHVSAMPGVQTPVQAGVALEAALSGTSRWVVGAVTNTTYAGASMYDTDGWTALGIGVATWGGEIDATIEVSSSGVLSRKVDWYDRQGESVAKRRFDFGSDLKSIRRKVADGPLFCRISPRGKGEETEGGGYGRKITIESVNQGKDYLENPQTAQLVRLPDGNGGWEYPTLMVENSEMETPADLLAWGNSVLEEYTTPRVTYTADVVQAAREGLDLQGVSLGDSVHVVDERFGGLRLSARVISTDVDMLDDMALTLKLGYIEESMTSILGRLEGGMSALRNTVAAINGGNLSTQGYLSRLLDRLNAEISADGGYFYIIEGGGARTYDNAVSDPSVGAEATKVIELKGGALRIADSRDAQGQWEWDTVFVSGHIASQLVTAARLVAGYIGSATSGNYWNLDTGEFRMSSGATLGDRTVQQALSGIDATITGVDVEYAQGTSPTTAPSSGWSTTAPTYESGKYIWSRTATTNASGTSYSTPVMISGREGTDGVGISSTTVSYGVSASAASEPSSWSGSAPSPSQGQWLWVRTVYSYTDGSTKTTYSKSYVGQDGNDGTSVTILGSYDTLAQLQAAHPTGSQGDSYMVGGDLYVWNGSAWEDVGQIQGPQGPAGANGTSVTIASIQYGTSSSGSTQPSSWSTTVPSSVSKGSWLWVKTTYSDASEAVTKSYVGTDGADGTSVYVQSATKVGDTTTLVIADSDGNTSTITIVDGQDGTNGTSGANGYVHTAWANSSDGTVDFSTSVSAGKQYLGVYTDNTAVDSTTPSDYSWSLIKGEDGSDGIDGETAYVHTAWANSADGMTDFSTSVSTGKSYLGVRSDFTQQDSQNPSDYAWSRIEGEQGEDGIGVSAVVEQYYLSSSSSSLSGGSWLETPPAYITGRFYWTRSQVTWSDGTVTTTTPVLARGLNSANSVANDAKDTATTANGIATAAKGTADANKAILDVLNTQQGVFDKLTNNGALQGLYMSNGQLYINATYIKTGHLLADLITAGKMQSANKKVYFDLTNNELRCNVLTSTYSNSEVLFARLANGYMGGDGTSAGGGYSVKGLLLYNDAYAGKGIALIPGTSSSGPRIFAADNGLRVLARTRQGGGSRDQGFAGMAITNNGYTQVGGQNATSAWNDNYVEGTSNAYLGRIVFHPRYSGSGTTYNTDGKVKVFGTLEATYSTSTFSSINVTGTKNRLVRTSNYGERLLSCYEMPTPMFGDVGSGTIGDDGLCYVMLDDMFVETVRTDVAYQVFLQKRGSGDIWVAEKAVGYFIVQGTPNLAFDWEVKAKQLGFENLRMEDRELQDDMLDSSENYAISVEYNYEDELDSLIEGIERAYDTLEDIYEAA